MISGDTTREAAIWRDFRQAQGHILSRRGRENPPPDAGILLLTFVILLLLGFIDQIVWSGFPPDFLFPVPPLRLFLASLLLLPLNAWLAQIRLARWTPQDRQRPAWVRVLRFGAACLFPFGDFSIVPAWQELLRRNPSWIKPQGGDFAHLTLRKPLVKFPPRPALERVHRSEILWFLMIIGSALPFVLGSFMLVDPEGILGRSGIIAFTLGLHVIGFLGISRIFRQNPYLSAGNPWARLLRASRWLMLFPSPVFIVSLLPLALSGGVSLRKAWIDKLYSSRSDALRFPLWKKAGEAFRPTIYGFSLADLTGRPPQVSTLPEEGRAVGKREALARFKILFLPPEAGLLTWLVAHNIGWQPQDPTLVALLATTGCLAFGSLLLQVLPGLAEKLRWDWARPLAPYLRNGALLLPAAGCLLGVFGGAGSALGNIQVAGLALELLALFLVILGLVYFFRGLVTKRFDGGLFLAWGFLYASLELLGLLLKASPGLVNHTEVWVLAIPVLSLAAGLALAPALLRPFTWGHIFDGRLPVEFRATLTAVGLTAILPLGGLAVPFWIWARQRLWQKYEDRILAS